MANKYQIQQIISNGTYVKKPFVDSSAATPTFSAVTAGLGGFIGDGSKLTNLSANSGITNNFVNVSGDTMTGGLTINDTLTVTGNTTIYADIIPQTDDTSNLGSGPKRFRAINTVSGYSSVWSATTKVYTQTLDLGLDSSGNTRTITANNSIIQDDILRGGTY